MQWLGCPLGSPHPISECLVRVQATLLPIQLSAGVNPGRQQMMAQEVGLLTPTWEAWGEFRILPSPGCCRNLGSEPTNGRSLSICLFFCFSDKMKINKKLKWKKKLQKEQTPTYLAGSRGKDSKWHFSELFMNMLICFPLFTSPLAFGHLIPPQWLLAFLTCTFKCLLSSWPS